MITNLLVNAVKYGKNDSIEVKITSAAGKATISVKDKGIGISAEDQERIFKRFERAVNKNEVSGFGLGLYIARQIVEQHGGKIWVESSPGAGSIFFVELPIQDQPKR